ncbi:MAG: hypothetical protein KF688_10725 [Pirellulales bacterium]|nr:hypothetical protein [Pirellulales bacterium]MBX3432122.1 hypothetical protein [Pirellulales bacterium]
MKSALPLATVVAGVLLLVCSLLWNVLFPASRVWTKDKSAQLTQLGNQATELKLQLLKASQRPSMHSGQSAAELQEQYDKVSAEYTALYNQFHKASESPKTTVAYLKWTGIGVILLGGALTLAARGA